MQSCPDWVKRTLVWGDIILEHPEILKMISDDIIIGAWTYGADDSFSDFIDPIKAAGFDFTVSPGILNSNRIIPDFRMTFSNIRKFIHVGFEKGTLGVYCTVWDDGGMHAFSRDWYGVAYAADQSWRPNQEDISDFDNRFSLGIYGDALNALPQSLNELNKLTDLAPTYEMNMNIFWKRLIPERGEYVTVDLGEWVEVKEVAQKSLEILGKGKSTDYSGDLDFIRFSINQYLFLAESRELLVAAADHYKKALELQLTEREKSLLNLKLAATEIQKLKEKFDDIVYDLERLWKVENRTYWFDRGMMNYESRQAAINNQLYLVNRAIADYEKGSTITTSNRSQAGHSCAIGTVFSKLVALREFFYKPVRG